MTPVAATPTIASGEVAYRRQIDSDTVLGKVGPFIRVKATGRTASEMRREASMNGVVGVDPVTFSICWPMPWPKYKAIMYPARTLPRDGPSAR